MNKFLLIVFLTTSLFSCSKKDVSTELVFDQNGVEMKSVLTVDEDISKLSVNYFNYSANEDNSFLTKDTTGMPLTIVKTEPTGVIPNEMTYNSEIYITFSDPIVPLSNLGAPIKNLLFIKIEPELKGTYRWLGSRLLSFKPDEKILPVIKYSVTIDKNLYALNGKQLEKNFNFSFISSYLDFDKIIVGKDGNFFNSLDDVPLEIAKNITVQFSYPVDLDFIKNFIFVENGGENFSFSVSRPKEDDKSLFERSIVLSFNKNFYENSSVFIKLSKGAAPNKNGEGRETEVVKSFSTLKPFGYENYTNYSYHFFYEDEPNNNPIFLNFTHELNKESVLNNIVVSDYKENLKENILVIGNSVRINKMPKIYDKQFNISIGKGIKDIYGRSLPKDLIVWAKISKPNPFVIFNGSGVKFLESEFEPVLSYTFFNIDEGKISVVKSDNPYSDQKSSHKNYEELDISKFEKNISHTNYVKLNPYLNKSGKGAISFYGDFYLTSRWTDYQGNEREEKYTRDSMLHLQVTDLAMTTKFAVNKLIVWVSSLSKGEPVDGVKVKLKKDGKVILENITDKNGLVVFNLTDKKFLNYFKDDDFYLWNQKFWDRKFLVEAEKGDDKILFSFLDDSLNKYIFGIYSSGYPSSFFKEEEEVLFFLDRDIYKPGEELFFRAIDFNKKDGKYTPNANKKWQVEFDSALSKEANKITGITTESGGSFGKIVLSKDIDVGEYYIKYTGDKREFFAYFYIENYRKAEFKVDIKSEKDEYISGEKIVVDCSAEYYSGGKLQEEKFDSYWWISPQTFFPSKEEFYKYAFGIYDPDARSSYENSSGKLTTEGETKLSIKTGTSQTGENIFKPGAMYNYNLEFSVSDKSNQQIASKKTFKVHPAEFYIGINSDKYFVKKGEKVNFNIVAITPQEEWYNDKFDINVQLFRREWKENNLKSVGGRVNVKWQIEDSLEYETKFSSVKKELSFSLQTKKVGQYFVKISSKDANKKAVFSEYYFYSTGSDWVLWRGDYPDSIEIVPDKEVYNYGDTAKLLIKSPIQRGKYLLTIEREKIIEERIIDMEGNANVIDIPIKKEYFPAMYIALHTYTGRTSKSFDEKDPDLGKPKNYFGMALLKVSSEKIGYDVEIKGDKNSYAPGEEAVVKIVVKDKDVPVKNAEVTFLAVDKGVLVLTDYKIPNPINYFYNVDNFPNLIIGSDTRNFLINPVKWVDKTLVGGDSGKAADYVTRMLSESEDKNMSVRKDFRTTAVFEPFLKTDENGEATVKFKFPDTLTTYSTDAVVVKNGQFGVAKKEFVVKNPVNIKINMPQELRLRDSFKGGVLLTNLTDVKQRIKVVAKSDILKIDGKCEQFIDVKPEKTEKVDFQFFAVKTGTANIEFIIMSEILNEKIMDSIDVNFPINSETFTVVGAVENTSAIEGIVIPKDIFYGFGGLSVDLNISLTSGFGYAVNDLFRYSIFYRDDLTGKIIDAVPHLIYGNDLSKYGKKYDATVVKKVIKEIEKSQNGEGGFINYSDSTYSCYNTTFFVCDFIYNAKARGYKVNIDEDNLLKYLASIYNSKTVSLKSRLEALYYQSLFGQNVKAQLKYLLDYNKAENVGLYGLMLSSLTYYKTGDLSAALNLKTEVEKYIKQTTLSVDLTELNNSGIYSSKTINLSLLATMYAKLDAKNPILRKIIWTMFTQGKFDCWYNSIYTAKILFSISNIRNLLGEDNSDLTASVSINDSSMVKEKLKKNSETFANTFKFYDEPISKFPTDKVLQATIGAKGKGTLYYSLALNYALPAEIVYARDEGFSVFSEVKDLNNKKVDGKLVAGETYKAEITVSTSMDRASSALTVSVPSGCEIINTAFATSAGNFRPNDLDNVTTKNLKSFGEFEDSYYWSNYYFKKVYYNSIKYEFENFDKGFKTIVFTFRAMYSGKYPTPGAFVECKFDKNIFGRSEGKLWEIK